MLAHDLVHVYALYFGTCVHLYYAHVYCLHALLAWYRCAYSHASSVHTTLRISRMLEYVHIRIRRLHTCACSHSYTCIYDFAYAYVHIRVRCWCIRVSRMLTYPGGHAEMIANQSGLKNAHKCFILRINNNNNNNSNNNNSNNNIIDNIQSCPPAPGSGPPTSRGARRTCAQSCPA
jgi:hypothetical protein